MAISINKNILWIIVIILIILNLVSITVLWLSREAPVDFTPPGNRMADTGRGTQYLKRELNFTPQQEAEFDSMVFQHRQKLEEKINEIRVLRRELMNMMQKQEFTNEAEQLVREIGEKQADLELMNFRHFRNVMEICNEEQEQILLNTLRNAVGPRRFRDGRGPHGPGWRRGR